VPQEQETKPVLVTAQDARRFEQLSKYQDALNLYRVVMRDSMSEEYEPNSKYVEELKSYVVAMYVDLKPEIDAREEFAEKFSKLSAVLESEKPRLSDRETLHFFLLIREVLGQIGIT